MNTQTMTRTVTLDTAEPVTAEVFFLWASGQSDGPDNLPAAAGLPDQDRKPYPGWTD